MEKYQIRFLESEKETICNGSQIFSQEQLSEHGKRGQEEGEASEPHL